MNTAYNRILKDLVEAANKRLVFKYVKLRFSING